MMGNHTHKILYVVAILAVVSLSGCVHGKGAAPVVLTRPAPLAEPPLPDTWPLAHGTYTISSLFGPRVRPGGQSPSRHKGIDLSARKGTPVYAAAPGEVIFSGTQTGYGNIVIIRHTQEHETAYAHLHKRGVVRGAHVRRGAAIGTVGMTGNATGPHLHYEVRRHGVAVNPESYLPQR